MEESFKHDTPLGSEQEAARVQKEAGHPNIDTRKLENLGLEADRLLDLIGEIEQAPIAPNQDTFSGAIRQGEQLVTPSHWYNQQNRQQSRCFPSPRFG